MTRSNVFGVVLAACAAVACGGPAEDRPPAGASSPAAPAPVVGVPPTVQRVTPILAVDAIEPVLPFWAALGFSPINPSWVDDKMIFVGLSKDGLEIHYQTKAHIADNIQATSSLLADTRSLVYVTVDNLDRVLAAIGDAEVVIPRRRTSWGSDEIYVREPGGNVIAFAAFGR